MWGSTTRACTGCRGGPVATTGSRGTPTAGSSRCSARPCATSRVTPSSTRWRTRSSPRTPTTTSTWTPTTCARSSTRTRGSSATTPGATSRRTRASSSTSPSTPSSTRGTPTVPCSTAARSGSRPTSAPPSTWSRWSSATWAPIPVPGSPSPGTRAAARAACTATTSRTPRARTWWPASATPCSLDELERMDKHSFDELIRIMSTLEGHYRDLCDIEFTIERGKLWMLQTRVGKRTAAAAFVIATQLVDEGLIDLDEALTRVTGAQLAQLMFPTFDLGGNPKPIARGIAASPGAAVGKAIFDSRRAAEVAADGREGDPGPAGDQPRRPDRHDRGAGHPHLARRQDLPRRRGRPRHGQDLRLRGRRDRRQHRHANVHCGRCDGQGGRGHLDRRHQRPGLPGRGTGAARPRWCSTSRARSASTATPRRRRTPAARPRRLDPQAQRAHQRRHPGGRRPGPPVRGRGHRPVPDRAHVPGRPARARRAADPGRDRGRAAGRAGRAAAVAARRLRRHLPGDGRRCRSPCA